MISFLNKKYANLGDPKFFRLAPVICYLSDVLVVYYVISTQLPKLINTKMIKLVIGLMNSQVARNMTRSDFSDISIMMQNQMAFALSIFLVFHLFIYALAAFKKNWPLKYISNYTFFGSLLTIIEVGLVLLSTGHISIFTFIALLGYLYVYLGYRYFKKVAQ